MSHSHHNAAQGDLPPVVLPASTKTEVGLQDVQWIRKGYGLSETQTFYLFPKEGGFVLLQVAYSEISYSPLTQVTLYIKTPSLTFYKSASYGGSSLVVSPQGFVCEAVTVEMQENANGLLTFLVSHKSKEAVMEFRLELTDKVMQTGDGLVRLNTGSTEDGTVLQQYGVRGNLTGHIMANKTMCTLDGYGTYLHQLQGIKPHLIASKWTQFTFQSDKLAVSTTSGHTPKHYGSSFFSTLAMRLSQDNHLYTLTSTNTQLTTLATAVDPHTGYEIPTSFRVTASGQASVAPADSTAAPTLEIETTFALDHAAWHRIDVLSEMPWLVRKAIQLLVANPYVYQFVVDHCEVVVKKDGKVLTTEKGRAMFELSFTNPE
ncbi:putative cell survival pathways protein [Sorochytrium milnesiophthora]